MKHKAIALTGTIGSGKSSVARYLTQKGYTVIDCDKIGKAVAQDKDVLQAVIELLGQESVTQGQLNRAWVRQKLFASDATLRQQYNNIFFGKIFDSVKLAVDNALSEIVFVEIPILDAFEFSWYQVWLVKCDKVNQLNRVAMRDNVTVYQAEQVLNAQREYESDVIIDNNGTLDQLYQKIDNQLKLLEVD